MTSSVETGPVYFWGHQGIDKVEFLSQWYPIDFTAPSPSGSESELTFNSTEQYMMYQKALLFEDKDIAEEILAAEHPKDQKALGRIVKNFDNKKWNANRELIVEEGNWYKFTRAKQGGEELRRRLLETGDRELVEASPYDKIWGIGFKKENADKNRKNWGLNLLGKALVRVRSRLREEAGKEAETASPKA